jgi:hypothetical protein
LEACVFKVELDYGKGDLTKTVTFTVMDNSNPSYTETITEDNSEKLVISWGGMLIEISVLDCHFNFCIKNKKRVANDNPFFCGVEDRFRTCDL